MKKMFTFFAVLILLGVTISAFDGTKPKGAFPTQKVEFNPPIPSMSALSSLTNGEQIMEKGPEFLYKVLSLEDWAMSQKVVHLSNMDNEFIHFATEAQLSGIIAKYWSGVPQYVVLKIRVSELPGNLVLETNPGGTNRYYHLYDGAIPFHSIVEVRKI